MGLAMMCAAMVPPETLRAMFAVRAREEMAECLLKLGRKDEAQKWMVDAADIRKKRNLGRNALFAGQVQAQSGQRTIEGRIKEEKKKSKKDPAYWQDRARYYRGRKEPALEEDALQKGLALTTPRTAEPQRHSRGHTDWRRRLLGDYARFLKREKRIGDAVALLRKELKDAPALSESAAEAARRLAFDFAREIRAADTVLWNWIASRPKWEHTEERLLWRLLESAEPDDLDRHFIRAEQLVPGQDPSRASTLGWIVNRMHFPKRSIPLLKYAVEKAQDKDLKERTSFTLFESYLDVGDWKHAEELFPEAAKRLTPKELPKWYARVAVAAAKAGAKSDAMRIWRRVANVNLSRIYGLEDMVKAEMADELKDFYREMSRQMPSSEAPARALKMLEQE